MKLLTDLKPEVARLHALLSEPEPGLMTWNLAVGRSWKAIVELWDHWDDNSATSQRANAEKPQPTNEPTEKRQQQDRITGEDVTFPWHGPDCP